MDTKEKILQAALELFSRDGYEAVSVSTIAGELGMTKGALYKHYDNKRAIFDSIVERMNENRGKVFKSFDIPDALFEGLPEKYRSTGIEKLYAYTLAQFVYWTEDSFAARFRRLLALERYRNPEMNQLYQEYLGEGPLEQTECAMRELRRMGYTDASPRYLALEFYGPVYALICLYDGEANKRVIAAKLKEHMEAFVNKLDVPEYVNVSTGRNYPRSARYSTPEYLSMLSGPNTLKLAEEMLEGNLLRDNARICDLNCGNGLTSLFMAKEYGYRVFAADPWAEPKKNQAFFADHGLDETRICASKADVVDLPFNYGYFDAIVCINSYNYFGQNKHFLSNKLLPYVKPGGYIYIVIPGMVEDCHENLPPELLAAWNPEQLNCLHDVHYWRGMLNIIRGADLLSIKPMEGMEEVWADWIKQDNPYAANDKRAFEAGAAKYLNFIKIVIRKR